MRAKHDAYRARKREGARERAHEKMIEIYIDAAYYFEMYSSDACAKTARRLKEDLIWLGKNRSEARQIEYLKDLVCTVLSIACEVVCEVVVE